MNYKRKVEKVTAFKVPQRVEFADGQIALEGDWLVFQDNHMVIYSDLDFNSSFEPDIPSIVIKDKLPGIRGVELPCADPYKHYYPPIVSYSSLKTGKPDQTYFDQRG